MRNFNWKLLISNYKIKNWTISNGAFGFPHLLIHKSKMHVCIQCKQSTWMKTTKLDWPTLGSSYYLYSLERLIKNESLWQYKLKQKKYFCKTLLFYLLCICFELNWIKFKPFSPADCTDKIILEMSRIDSNRINNCCTLQQKRQMKLKCLHILEFGE